MTPPSYQSAPELVREHLALSEHDLAREVALYREALYRSLDVLHDTLQALDTLQDRYERLLDENRALRAAGRS